MAVATPTRRAAAGHARTRAHEISVVICAYTERRWNDLVAAVQSVQRQTTPPAEIVVVIDHNPGLFARAQQALEGVRIVENQHARGLSGARNTGVAVSMGALVAFLDDDALAEPTWLEQLTACFQAPDVLGAGGAVDPLWAAARPRWFPDEFAWVVGCSYRGLPRATRPVRNPIGASMCIRREVFAAIGGFRDGIGRLGTRPLGCEETELCIRARQRWPERVFVYEPRARVRHRVPVTRAGWAYFRSRCYAEGLSKAAVARHLGAGPGLGSERTYVLRTLPLGIARGLADAALGRDPAGLARAGAIVAGLALTTAGYLRGSLFGSSGGAA
jgi:glycosyltransferase involved in cell wall biosynthesis